MREVAVIGTLEVIRMAPLPASIPKRSRITSASTRVRPAGTVTETDGAAELSVLRSSQVIVTFAL